MARNRQKKKRSGLSLAHNKMFFGLFLSLLTVVLVINATFAWSSFAKWRYNHMQGNKKIEVPSIVLDGYFDGDVLTQDKEIERNITVVNNGKIPVVVRVSAIETLAAVEVDTTDQMGNGHLKEYSQLAGKTLLKLDAPLSWSVGNRYSPTGSAPYYQVDQMAEYPYRIGEENRPTSLTYVSNQWGLIDPIPSLTSGFWLYQEQNGKGYYYYSDILEPGERTTVLLKDTSLLDTAPNRIKGALHRWKFKAEAGEAMKGVYDEWHIPMTSGNSVYERFETILPAN